MQIIPFGLRPGMLRLARRDDDKVLVAIGCFLEIPFLELRDAKDFCAGYRSGIARIAKSSYNLPTADKCDSVYARGFRFAFLAHFFGRKHSIDDFPEAIICQR